jgi:hypothetical protein
MSAAAQELIQVKARQPSSIIVADWEISACRGTR